MIPLTPQSALKCGVLCAVLGLLVGCGGASPATAPVTTPAVPVAAAIDGRWEFETSSTLTTLSGVTSLSSAVVFTGVLANNNGTVTGVGQANFSGGTSLSSLACVFPTAVKVHGTLSSARHLTLTSDVVNGTTFTFEADIPSTLPDSTSPIDGITVTGSATGSCPVATASGFGNFSSALTGTYTGTLSNLPLAGGVAADPATPAATMSLTETDPDATTGVSTITGQAKVTFPTCSVTLPISQTRVGARNGPIALYPATAPVVATFALKVNRAGLLIAYLGSDCKTLPVVPSSLPPMQWSGSLIKQ